MQKKRTKLFSVKTLGYGMLCLLVSCFLAACEKPIEPSPNPNPSPNENILLVGNEGSFGTNTASLSTINLENKQVTNNVYKNTNGQALGDVLQSVTRIGEAYYLVVNNSNKIVVTDANFKQTHEIINVVSPRYIKAISAHTAYVTSLFNDKIYVIDLIANAKIAEIQMDKNWTEQMVLSADATGDFVYVCEKDTAINYLTKISTLNHQIVGRIPLAGYAPSQLGMTSDQHLWVLGGNNFHGKVGTLTELDPSSNQIIQSFTFPAELTLIQMAIGPHDEKYITVVDYTTNNYYVYKFEKNATTFPADYFLQATQAENFYGLTVDQESGDVFISDTKGFTQAGAVNRYSSTGQLLHSWTTGIGPSSFYFAR